MCVKISYEDACQCALHCISDAEEKGVQHKIGLISHGISRILEHSLKTYVENLHVILFKQPGDICMLCLRVETKHLVKHSVYDDPIKQKDICILIHRKIAGRYVPRYAYWLSPAGEIMVVQGYLIFCLFVFPKFLQ